MEQILIILGLGVLGLIVGSFGGATVWRLRARQLKEDKAAGEEVNKAEFSRLHKLLGKSVAADRSVCLHCHHQLLWYDLLPLVSWLALRGKCRYCRKPIGTLEPLIEIGMAVFFVVSFLVWPVPWEAALSHAEFSLWLIVGAGLIILFAYDVRWFLLPNRVVFPLMVPAALIALIHISRAEDIVHAVVNLVIAGVILSGVYYMLYIVSRGAWIGFGDVKLGIILALVLGEWQLAFLTLFLANIIGCLVVLPGLLTGKLKRTSHVPFGPMLIAGFFVVGLFGNAIIDWYLGILLLN